MVSNAKLDLPEPERPVITVSESRGISTSMLRRLCSRAPRMTILSIPAPSGGGREDTRRVTQPVALLRFYDESADMAATRIGVALGSLLAIHSALGNKESIERHGRIGQQGHSRRQPRTRPRDAAHAGRQQDRTPVCRHFGKLERSR